ncbi:MAG TPA: alpha/beta hydrolase [Kofleriaceae bacterium]|jgi:pimeloyl-ACP methyl ester carboxylesterase
MQSKRLALATGITAHVLEWDAPGDTTVVLVHGFLDFAYGWHEVAPLIGTHVVAVDVRGHGDSDWVGAGGYYYYMDYVADLDDVIRQLARKRVIVVGHSMGGGVVSYWAGARPERVAGVALLEGLGPPDESTVGVAPRAARWIDGWRTARREPTPMTSIEVAAARLRKNDPLLAEALALRLAEHGTKRVDGGFVWKHDPLHRTQGPYPFRLDFAAQFWRAIACPVLAIDGADSRLNLSEAERASRRSELRNVRHVVVPAAGHMMMRHQPVAIAGLIADLVR